MRKSTTPLTPAQVYRFAIDFCQPHLDLRGKGKVTATVLLTVLFAAAARLSSISETCSPTPRRPLRRHLRQGPLRRPHRPSSRSSARSMPPSAPTCPGPCAASASGRSASSSTSPSSPIMANMPWTTSRSTAAQKKAGTRSFFAYATAYVLLHGQRFTLAVVPVTRAERLKDVLQELLHLVSKAGLRPGLLLLDRGFYKAEIIRYLQQARRPFLMPVTCHGRDADHPKGPSGSKVFKLMKKSGWFTHTVGDAKKKGRAKATVSICVKRARVTDRHGRKKWHTWVYAYWGITPKRVDWVKRTYRKRFGIETSYRQMNQCRIRTTTKKFNVRFLYVAIGLLLRNLWVWLHHVVLSTPAAGLPAVQLGAAPGGADAAVAGAGGRGFIWFSSHGNNRKGCTAVGCDLTRRSRSFGKY